MNDARKQAEQLRVECSDRDAQEVLTEAIERVPGFSVPPEIAAADRRLPVGLASLAIGDRQFAQALLPRLQNADYLVMAARYFLWSGAEGILRAELPRIDEALSSCEPFAELHELAVALESIGAGAEAAAARAGASSALRRILPAWELYDCNLLPAGSPADTVNVFVHALLGIAPDAARGRLRVRTCLPDWLDSLTVHNIRLGDALVSLQYRRESNVVQYIIEQVAGAIPVRLVFEPTFPHAVAAVDIDGVRADLQLQTAGGRTTAPVQLMLDHERVLLFRRT